MKTITAIIAAAAALAAPTCSGFSPVNTAVVPTRHQTSLSLSMNSEEDIRRFEKAARYAGPGENFVELRRPLGLVLDQDDYGNVFVQTVAPKGNAARAGTIKEGDIVTMCSATFGDQMWSTRGVGLTRVLAAIRVRSGPTVSLVFESPSQRKMKGAEVAKAAQAARDAREKAQAKRDELLKELEADEKKIKKGKFMGLF
jgi:NACalpha-BTF3-like transcription factor